MHIVYVLAPFGGPEAYVQTLIPWLESQGHRVSVVYTVLKGQRSSPFPAHIQVEYAVPKNRHAYVARIFGGFRAWPLRVRAKEEEQAVEQAIRRIAAANPVDVVEVTEGILVQRLSRHWAVVVRAHGSDWTFRNFCERLAPGDQWLIRMQHKQFERAHAVSAISRHLADYLAEVCSFPRRRIGFIPYPIGDEWLNDGNERTPAAPDEAAVMVVGRLEKRKGTDQIVRAMVQVWRRYPRMQIYLAGLELGFTREHLLGMVPDGCRQQMTFLGFVPRDQLRQYYRKITAYVAPSSYETFGYTILEAMASGLPVIATRTGAIPELIEEGVNGFLTAMDDIDGLAGRIETLVERPDLAHAMATSSRKKALAYALAVIGPEMEDLYAKARSVRQACC